VFLFFKEKRKNYSRKRYQNRLQKPEGNAMPNPHLSEYGTPYRFSSTNQPAKRGRLPSKLKKFCKDNAISKDDVDMVFKNLIFGKTIEELQDMIKPGKKEKLPVIVVLLISAFIQDMKSGTLKEVNTVLDRIFGKPTQQLDISERRGDIPDDPEERRALMEQIEKELGLNSPPASEPKPRTEPKGENGK
jgi:hypothetical protein